MDTIYSKYAAQDWLPSLHFYHLSNMNRALPTAGKDVSPECIIIIVESLILNL